MQKVLAFFVQHLYKTRDPAVAPPSSAAPGRTYDGSFCKQLSEEEISNALFHIGPLKAPKQDGLPGRFFQRNRAVLKHDVIPECIASAIPKISASIDLQQRSNRAGGSSWHNYAPQMAARLSICILHSEVGTAKTKHVRGPCDASFPCQDKS